MGTAIGHITRQASDVLHTTHINTDTYTQAHTDTHADQLAILLKDCLLCF